MAFVQLGRCERLSDIYIIPEPELNVDAIRCDPEALAETERLEKIFDDTKRMETQRRDKYWQISFLNVRSIKALDGHREDVSNDELLMTSDLLGLGETWLEKDQTVHFPGFSGYFSTSGQGKGIAGYTKLNLIEEPKIISTKTCSAILFKTTTFHIIFLYLSKDYKEDSVTSVLLSWIDNVPTAVLGDMNEDILKSSKIQRFMRSKGFHQVIKEPTCSTGSLIDHIYVNDSMSELGIFSELDAVYYSDHDVITLYVSK